MLFKQIKLDDEYVTKYVWNHAMPSLFIPFVIYGPLQVFFKYIKLVDVQAMEQSPVDQEDK